MTKIRIGGVPEHFNLPWHLSIDENLFKKKGIEVLWQDYPAGTGAMCKDLRSGELDIAVLLTEGIVADIINGSPSKLVHWYVETPLIWGIHTASNKNIGLEQLSGKKYAISRKGSGSHLMAFVDAQIRGLEIKEEQFVLVENLSGARKSLKEGSADIFFWEKFMTKPFVDNYEFKRIGERPTPWPCFVIAANDNFISSNSTILKQIIDIVTSRAQLFKTDQQSPSLISQKFDIKSDDAVEWLIHTSWAQDSVLEEEILKNVINTLFEIKVISKKVAPKELCAFI